MENTKVAKNHYTKNINLLLDYAVSTYLFFFSNNPICKCKKFSHINLSISTNLVGIWRI